MISDEPRIHTLQNEPRKQCTAYEILRRLRRGGSYEIGNSFFLQRITNAVNGVIWTGRWRFHRGEKSGGQGARKGLKRNNY
jgi:hypothetical protein